MFLNSSRTARSLTNNAKLKLSKEALLFASKISKPSIKMLKNWSLMLRPKISHLSSMILFLSIMKLDKLLKIVVLEVRKSKNKLFLLSSTLSKDLIQFNALKMLIKFSRMLATSLMMLMAKKT